MNYKDIFDRKAKFKIIHSYVEGVYQFQSNDDKGEFINENNQVIAQLIDASPEKDYFVVGGIFMGQINTISLQYKNLIDAHNIPISFDFEE
jgi:hypothetical protein